MGGFLTERLPVILDEIGTGLRYFVRRYYLRKDIKRYGNYRDALTKEQRKAAAEYWHKYTKHFSPLWHEMFTAKTGVFDVRYVPADIQFTEIEGRLNDWNAAHGIDNKNNYSMYFPEVKQPRSVFRKMHGIYHADDYSVISKEQAILNCIDCGDVIFKVAIESGKGLGISFWKTEDGIDALRTLVDRLGADVNAQEFIKQHAALEAINASSVNIIRVITLMSENGVRLISSYLQLGGIGCRQSQIAVGGVAAKIREDGTLCAYGVDRKYNRYTEHPSGLVYEGFRVPGYHKTVEAAKRLHGKMGSFRIISWDFAVSPEEEPVLIETNLKYGGVMFHQLSDGPLYGDDTDALLDEIFGKKDN